MEKETTVYYINVPVSIEARKKGFQAMLILPDVVMDGRGKTPIEAVQNLKSKLHGAI